MWQLFWLLLPAAAASGYWIGRKNTRKRVAGAQPSLRQDYFRGLNYVLNDKPDKAIEVFIKMVEVDSDTVETHAALGNLFRRRGEVDRAIRIHQNLIARPTLSRVQRAEALRELGEDYMRAGLFDRAERLFLELLDMKLHVVSALRSLVAIYEQERDWGRAVEFARRLENEGRVSVNRQIAHYYCEIAENARRDGDFDAADAALKKAFASDSACVRASILQGDMAFERADYPTAIQSYQQVAEQDLDYLSEVMEKLRDAFTERGEMDQFRVYLKDMMSRCQGIAPMLALADLTQREEGNQAAIDFVTCCLRNKSSVAGLKRLIELKLPSVEGRARDDLMILREMMTNLISDRPIYRCNNCGFAGKQMHWHCPSCKSWSTIKPIPGIVPA
ncbi:MAG: lipopolysaccharide assembly protein LapB [Gammaproteobacteria bacterium]|nr:lipopolysaccharide assembly protein LapB [Gammaproteobacteria bacterium]MCP5135855.1 lipopolysaccharide assembly protein LapB [Gammaproteobacteria bacterium]